MRIHAALAGALFLATVAGAAHAADDETKVLATVNGVAITESDYLLAKESLPDQYKSAPDEMLREALLGRLVDQKLIVAAARADGLDKNPAIAARAASAADQIYLNAWLGERVQAGVSDAEVRTIYDARVQELGDMEEVNARHILVTSEDEAKAIKAEIDAGADFATVAAEKSTGPSGPNGGDLGWFAAGAMVKEFSDAAFGLEKGAVSAPVQTQFGWHVIKLEDRRKVAPPAFEEMAEEIRNNLAQNVIKAEIEKLRADAKIERVDMPAPAETAPAEAAPAAPKQ